MSDEQAANDITANMNTDEKPKTSSECSDSSSKRSNSSTGNFNYGTPAKKIKSESSVDYIASPRETRRMRTDLIEARHTILNLENRIQHMHNVRKEMQIMFDNEMRSIQQQRDHDRKSVVELESQLQDVRKREIDAKSQLIKAKNKYDTLKVDTDMRIEGLEKELAEIKCEKSTAETHANEEIGKLNGKVEELSVLLEAVQEDAKAHKKLSEELEKRLSEKNAVERDLELKDQALQKARLELKELDYLRANFLEYQQQIKTHQHKLIAYTSLEKENIQLKGETKRLKDAVHNKLLLEEEVYNLKNRLASYKEQETTLAELQTTQVQMSKQLNEWLAVAHGVCDLTGGDSNLPYLLKKLVEHLQHQEITLTSEKVQLQSQLNNITHEAKVARSEQEKGQNLISKLQKDLRYYENVIHRMQKKLMLISRERDSYRIQLDSYEKDLTMCVTPLTLSQSQSINAHRERIENLQQIIEAYKDMVAKLESDLQNVEPNTESAPIRVEQVQRLQSEVDMLRLENNNLRQKRDQLEIRLEELLVGDDANSGRIVHLSNNPLTECTSQRDNQTTKLQEEVERLKRKIRHFEEGLDVSKCSDISMSSKEVRTVKEQLQTTELQLQRLKECFKSSMQEFRNVIYMLLGYKVDKSSNSQYKLTSMYAEQPEDHICFQLNPEGTLHLLENEFSSTLEEMVDLHLRHQKSIPLFLSAITMDLFNNRTMDIRTYEIDDNDDDSNGESPN